MVYKLTLNFILSFSSSKLSLFLLSMSSWRILSISSIFSFSIIPGPMSLSESNSFYMLLINRT